MGNLRLTAITKRFGAIAANDNVYLTVREGSIHGLLGENGAGKSTLMNILSGLYQPDSGKIFLGEEQIQIRSPADAIRYGIGMIHQHFMLVNQLTVVENVILGQSKRAGTGLRLNLKEQSQAIAHLAKTYGLEVPPMSVVSTLPVGIQQRVEILKVLYRQARILILDEPTAVLTPSEIQSFLNVLKQLAARNHTIIFISHKLDEVMAACDEVTILRRGQVIRTLPTNKTSRTELARLMVDRAIEINTRPSPQRAGDVVLDIQDLWVSAEHREVAALQGLSLQLRAGEIFGIAGVDGNGQRELADVIARLLPIQKGSIQIISPTPSTKPRSTSIAYIPEDRQKQGLVLSFSIARNLIIKAFSKLPFCRQWILRKKEITAHANQAIQAFDIRASSPQLKASQLSGGNQQKIILARELAGRPALIIAMQPTRGLDIGATAAVQQSLLAQRGQGAAILYISTELEEVMAMSDRLGVIYRGQLIDSLDPHTATLEQVGLLMAGQASAEPQESNGSV
ncbi:ABC transporter, ATP-binding protein [Synechococcus sp. PCC 7335]|uniref:ABC transporter ATP-binding protein n=1 Tax=Synechococcus sp. (strain ATCC 29403 / PCC 7335) TaxID=91464 RepID=UPI00017ED5DF|nr:ABC transporter ATP-binding protein [Synechococcus sp. PCC 7335]EDX86510.1 ABC transporter, ATP-binding protein [Synechococcus sp. PCC 7335]